MKCSLGISNFVSLIWTLSGRMQGQRLWVQQTWVWRKPSWRRLPLTHHRAARTHTGLGSELLAVTNRASCTRTKEKGAVTPQETDPDLAVSVQESPAEAWVSMACCRPGGTECCSVYMGSFEGGRHYLHYLHHDLAPGK